MTPASCQAAAHCPVCGGPVRGPLHLSLCVREARGRSLAWRQAEAQRRLAAVRYQDTLPVLLERRAILAGR